MSEALITRFEERSVQTEALDAIEAARLDGEERGLLNMATGLGKTFVAASDVNRFIAENPGARVLYLCHNNDILTQAHETFAEVLGPDVTHGYAFGGTLEDQRQVVYASFQTMNTPFGDRPLHQMFSHDEYDYVVVDESHHGPAKTYRQVIEYFEPQFMLGLSATPHRRDGRDVLELFGRELYTKTLEEALAEGLLTPVHYKTYTDRVREMVEDGEMIEGITLAELNKVLFIPRRDEEIAEILFDEMAEIENLHGMIFCQSIEHAERMAQLLPDAVAIHSKLKPELQRELKTAFKNGEFPLACVVDKFNEGIDLPTVNFVGFLRSTSSWRVWLQQLGRGLRKAPGKHSVTIVDLAANVERIEMILQLEDEVRRITEQNERPVREVEPPFAPKFTEEARSVVKVAKDVRARMLKRYAELTPIPLNELSLPIATLWDIEEPYNRDAEHLSARETIDFTPRESLLMAKIFESPTGSVDIGKLREAYKVQFKQTVSLAEIKRLMDGLKRMGLASHCAWQTGEKRRTLYRLTSRGIEAFMQIEPYKSQFEQSFSALQECLERHFSKHNLQPDMSGMGM